MRSSFSPLSTRYPAIRLLILLLFLSVPALAQSPSKVLKQAEKALGGVKAVQSSASWTRTGKITRLKDGASGKFQLQTAAPNLYRVSYDLDGFESEAGYSGRSGWARDSRQGLNTLTGDASRNFQAEALYRNNLWLNYKKEKSKIASGGQAVIDGKQANIVTLTTVKGVPIRIYFDAVTGLPVREEIPSGDGLKTFDYADYRPVNEINQPFTVTYKTGDDVYEIKLDDIRPNASIARTAFDFPNVSGEALPDIPKLLAEIQTNEERVEKILDTYSYTQKYIHRELQKDGTLKAVGAETYQLSFYKGYRISRKVEENDVPLNEKQQASEDKEVAKRVEDIEKIIAKKEAKAAQASGAPEEESRRVSIAELLRASQLLNPRRERFKGREVIVFDFEPNPDFDYKNAKSMLKFFGKTVGVMWIDEKDKQVVRLEAALADSFNIGGGVVAKLKKGASFIMQQERVNDEIWLPSQMDINVSVRLFLVKGIDVNQLTQSYNYRKFTTEVKDAKVNEVQKP
jgi:outer membrane lipoprotein-sorting protein